MTSFVRSVVVVGALVVMVRPVLAQNAQADQLNDQGKELYKQNDFQGAAAKFREAIQLQPDARYYFNLCAALEKSGDYDGALEACDQVYQYNPTDEQKAKTGQRSANIRQLKKQRGDTAPAGGGGGGGGGDSGGRDVPPGGGGGPGGPGGPGGGGGGGGGQFGGAGFQPPVVEKAAEPEYKWSVGGEIGPVLFTNGDQLPDVEDVDATFALRAYADRLVPQLGVGVRFFLEFQQFTSSADAIDVSASATLFGVGVGGYRHFKIAPNLFFTPALTVQIAGYSIDAASGGLSDSTAVGTFGVGAAAGLNYVIAGKHVLWVTPVSLTYLAPGEFDNGANFDGGTSIAFTFGYSLRFTRELFTNVVRLE